MTGMFHGCGKLMQIMCFYTPEGADAKNRLPLVLCPSCNSESMVLVKSITHGDRKKLIAYTDAKRVFEMAAAEIIAHAQAFPALQQTGETSEPAELDREKIINNMRNIYKQQRV